MQEERAEAKAEIAELEEQLKRLSAVEGAWADQVAQGEELPKVLTFAEVTPRG